MRTQKPSTSTPLPGIFPTLKAGFELTSKHWWLVLLPALLDSFYWLGPRLSPRILVEKTVEMMGTQTAFGQLNRELINAAQQTNLFTTLTVPLFGVPTLMKLVPEDAPLSPQVVEVQSFATWFWLFLVFNLVGILLTALYFSLVAQAVKQRRYGRMAFGHFVRQVMRTWGQLVILGLVLLLAALFIFLPLLLVGGFLSLLNGRIFFLVVLIGMMLIFWIAIFLGFTPHGLTLNGRTLPQALFESVQLVRLNYVSTMILLLAITGISTVMDRLLLYADDGSWLTLSSILGHAFISTGLVAATYVFYQDRVAIHLIIQRQTLSGEQIEENKSNG
jgi:hypothetical protein